MKENKSFKIVRELSHLWILFSIGAFIYLGIEIAYRGFTHWTMGMIGGICFVIIGGLNNYWDWKIPVWKQCLVGMGVITAFEFVSGVILNLILKLHIWDYSGVPFNILGQVCLPFCAAWILLSGVAIVIDDFVRWVLFKEEFPHYNWL